MRTSRLRIFCGRPFVYAALALLLGIYTHVRVKAAKHYMIIQMERLALKGLTGYQIYEVDHYASNFDTGPVIVVKARRPEASGFIYGDGFHYIEIGYPWIPWGFEPAHRI